MKTQTLLLTFIVILLYSFNTIQDVKFHKKLKPYIDKVEAAKNDIPDSRKTALKELGDYLVAELASDNIGKVLIVSRHNSRRSHMGQLWFEIAAAHYGIKDVNTFSGGVEPTSFNERAVNALNRAGLKVSMVQKGENPRYSASFSPRIPSMFMYSKLYNDIQNPQENFIALVLSEVADKQLDPFPGADKKISILYEDMENSDGSSEELATYDKGCMELAKDMFFLMSYIKQNASI